MTQQLQTDFENLNKEELNDKLIDVGYTASNAAVMSDFWLLEETQESYSAHFQSIIDHVNLIEKVSDLDVSLFIREYSSNTLLAQVKNDSGNVKRYFVHYSTDILSIYTQKVRKNTLFVSKINSTKPVALPSIDQEDDFI